ncbi:MAG TPA: hypothetical protein VFL97_08855 [Nitrococcus sp.]|nr:hypothetical protein [Nitrococcus sp.]
MRKTWFTFISLVLLAVTGCQYIPAKNEHTPARNEQNARAHNNTAESARTETADQIFELLSYYRGLQGLDENGLKTLLAQLRDSWGEDDCSMIRLKSAMVLSQLPVNESDTGANAILDPCLGSAFSQSSAKGKLAFLLRDLIEARRAASGAQAEARGYHHQLKALQDENQKLHKQLEGLKAIEKSIQQRNRH